MNVSHPNCLGNRARLCTVKYGKLSSINQTYAFEKKKKPVQSQKWPCTFNSTRARQDSSTPIYSNSTNFRAQPESLTTAASKTWKKNCVLHWITTLCGTLRACCTDSVRFLLQIKLMPMHYYSSSLFSHMWALSGTPISRCYMTRQTAKVGNRHPSNKKPVPARPVVSPFSLSTNPCCAASSASYWVSQHKLNSKHITEQKGRRVLLQQ